MVGRLRTFLLGSYIFSGEPGGIRAKKKTEPPFQPSPEAGFLTMIGGWFGRLGVVVSCVRKLI